MGERRWRASREAGKDTVPAIVKDDRGGRPPARRPAREPPPQPAQRPRGGGGLPAAARRLRLHPGGARPADRPVATADLQHAAPAQAAPARRSVASPPACSAPATPGRCSASRTPRRWSGSRSGSSPRASRCAPSRRSSTLGDGDTPARAPRPAGRRPSPPARRPRRRPVRPPRDAGAHRPGPAQGPAHRGVRLRRGPQPHPRRDAPARGARPDRRRPPGTRPAARHPRVPDRTTTQEARNTLLDNVFRASARRGGTQPR